MNRILMIDDDTSFLNIYSNILKSNGYFVDTAASVSFGMKLLEKTAYNIVILDIVMPEMNGLDALKIIKKEYPNVLVIMLTGEGSISGAVETMEIGAYTYLIKPIEIDQLLLNIKRAEEYLAVKNENANLRSQIRLHSEKFEYIGKSESVKNLKERIEIVAPTNASILITGESGTGKEIIANLIHIKSIRSNGPMIKVNCAALSENLLETELFGHEKGAFTGAIAMKRGRFNAGNSLKRLDGGAFEETIESGAPIVGLGTSQLIGGNVEQSNTDIADEFSKMIVTQQAYSANTKVISTAQEMLRDVFSIIR